MPKGTEARLQEMGLVCPRCPRLAATISRQRRSVTSSISPGYLHELEGVITGTIGIDRTIDEGYDAARACALTQLAVLQRHVGSLDVVKGIVSVNGYVNAVAGFQDSPKVINGASDLFVKIFGDEGRHVRAAIGVSACRATRWSNCK